MLDLLDATALDADGADLLLATHRRLGTRLRLVVERGGPVHERLKERGSPTCSRSHRSRATALAASAAFVPPARAPHADRSSA